VASEPVTDGLTGLAQLRHAYANALNGNIRNQQEYGRHLLGPAIERVETMHAAFTAARAEVAEADGVIAVWRRRTEQAEATAARLVGILRDLVDVQNGPPLEKYRADWEDAMERARAALAAQEADRG
jgi:hypothetical protein